MQTESLWKPLPPALFDSEVSSHCLSEAQRTCCVTEMPTKMEQRGEECSLLRFLFCCVQFPVKGTALSLGKLVWKPFVKFIQ